MDEHTSRVLEFGKILEMASVFAVTVPGKTNVKKIVPLNSPSMIRQRISLVSEFRELLSERQNAGIEHFDDILHLFQKIRPADAVLDPFELRSLLPLFYSASNLKVLGEHPACPELGVIVSQLTAHPHFGKAINKTIDAEGKIRDSASPELSKIRKSIKSYEDRIKNVLDGILSQKEFAPYLQDFYLAERHNRWVLPVKTDFKGNIPGVVHDISNTGETVYVEPYTIQHLGNELESYRAEEKLEEFRILQRMTSLLREHLQEIEKDYHIVAAVDALQAVALFSEQMNMYPPEINEHCYMKITKGKHPLLWKTLRKENRESDLVPLDIEIGKDNTCMVITGSNAGGKTVSLKTIGVLNLMALSGMHIPAGSGSSIPYLRNVLADIGDEQSIEQNLSTFSAHITRISEIIRHGGPDTLVIIDELGTGTDPEQGSALSCAILRKLRQQRAVTFVSTHLGMLKVFAHSEPGMINAAMEMEEILIKGVATYKPTYKLVIGEPGASHAFEIAESLGLQQDIIKEARQFISGEGAEVESLISELRQKTSELDNKLKETEIMKKEIDHLRIKLSGEISQLKARERETLSIALREAEDFVRKTRREARDIIESLRQSSLKEASDIVKKLDATLEQIITIRRCNVPEKTRQLAEVSEGQRVFIRALKTHGEVHSINKKTGKCKVNIDGKEIDVPFSELSEASAGLKQVSVKPLKNERPLASAEEANIFDEINIIGQRVDPAISLIERYLNDASVADFKQVKIIHGFGTGILSRAVRDYLKNHPLVENFRKGNEDEGGDAVTIVVL